MQRVVRLGSRRQGLGFDHLERRQQIAGVLVGHAGALIRLDHALQDTANGDLSP